jgi:hypothetical protein
MTMDLEDHVGFLALAGVDLLAIVACAVALMWAAVRDGREMLRR